MNFLRRLFGYAQPAVRLLLSDVERAALSELRRLAEAEPDPARRAALLVALSVLEPALLRD